MSLNHTFIALAQQTAMTAVRSTFLFTTFLVILVFVQPFRVWRSRRDLAQFADMDEHELRDIGLTRADVTWARNLPLNQEPTQELARIAEERRRR